MRSQRGFSLVELLFALLVLTIVITTSLGVFVRRTERLQQAADVMLAYQVLANESEVVRRTDFHALDSLRDDFTTDTTLINPLRPFKTKVKVRTTQPGVKNVTLSITWHDNQRHASLEIVRADTGGTNLW